jgi:hypothetical protein
MERKNQKLLFLMVVIQVKLHKKFIINLKKLLPLVIIIQSKIKYVNYLPKSFIKVFIKIKNQSNKFFIKLKIKL